MKNIFAKIISITTILSMTFVANMSNVALATTVEEGETCQPQVLVSTGGENGTVAVDPTHPAWTALIPGAEWVWSENPIADAVNETSQTFTRTFTIVGEPMNGSLEIAADNHLNVDFNGVTLIEDNDEDNYSSSGQASYVIPASFLNTGLNTVEFTVTNLADENGTMETNPAGLMYKMTINCHTDDDNGCDNQEPSIAENQNDDCNDGNNCNEEQKGIVVDRNDDGCVTIIADKIICPEESMLPNWGAGGPDITSTTASDWLASHEECELADWDFEWAYYNTPNPGDNDVGVTGGDWNAFSGSTNVPMPEGTDNDTKLWVREVMRDGYIPFEGADNSSDVSAEIYCHTDVLNYDNYERVDDIEEGGTYNCVAWNVGEIPEKDGPSCESQEMWARVIVTNYSNQGAGDLTNTVYLGSDSNTVASGEWFKLSDLDASDIDTFADVPGLAVQRKAGQVVLELHGSHPQVSGNRESVKGYIEFFNSNPTAITPATGQNKFEGAGSFHEDLAWMAGDKAYFDLEVLDADDRFTTDYSYFIDESCQEEPSCDAPTMWARVIITEFSNEGAGDMSNTIYLGSDSNTVASGEWFLLSDVDAMNIEDFADVPGLAVKRRNDGKIVLELHGSQGVSDREVAKGYIEFFNSNPTAITPATGQNKLETSGSGHLDLAYISADKVYFDLMVNTSDDRFTTAYTYAEDEDCGEPENPPCDGDCNPQCEVDCDEDNNDDDQPSCEETQNCDNDPEDCDGDCEENNDNNDGGNNGGGSNDANDNSNRRTSSSGSAGGGGGGQVLGAKTGDVLGACVQFTEYHKKGDKGGEIPMIQEFLNEELGLNLEVNGIYDQATFNAVKAFQKKYFNQIISPWFPALPLKVTGKWYKTTRMMANEIISCPEPEVYLEDPKIMYKVKWAKPQ